MGEWKQEPTGKLESQGSAAPWRPEPTVQGRLLLPQGLSDEAHPIRAPALAQVGRTPPPKFGPLVFKRGFWRRQHRAHGAQGSFGARATPQARLSPSGALGAS